MHCLRDLMMIKLLNSCLRKTLSETMIFAANDRKFNSICNFSYDKELFVSMLLMSWIIFWCLSDDKWVIILIKSSSMLKKMHVMSIRFFLRLMLNFNWMHRSSKSFLYLWASKNNHNARITNFEKEHYK